MNFIDGSVSGVSGNGITARVGGLDCGAQVRPKGLEVSDAVTLGIRPEHVQVGEGLLLARVNHVERLGELSYLYLDVNGSTAPLLAKTQRENITIDDSVSFSLPPEAMHVFRADGSAQPRPGR